MFSLSTVVVIAVVFFSLGIWFGRIVERHIQARKFEARVKNNEFAYKNITQDVARFIKELQ